MNGLPGKKWALALVILLSMVYGKDLIDTAVRPFLDVYSLYSPAR